MRRGIAELKGNTVSPERTPRGRAATKEKNGISRKERKGRKSEVAAGTDKNITGTAIQILDGSWGGQQIRFLE